VLVEAGLSGVRKERMCLCVLSLYVGDGGAGRLEPLGTLCWSRYDAGGCAVALWAGGKDAMRFARRSLACLSVVGRWDAWWRGNGKWA
jgi:hypothetical protein